MAGKFIVVEGIEGAGKSSCIAVIEDVLRKNGITDLEYTREPGGTPIAEKLRAILLEKGSEKVSDETELLLMYASRVQLVNNKIKPALEQGRYVIGDRHDLSSVAYQGGGRGISLDLIKGLKRMVLGDFKPDLTILMDVTPEIGLSRVDNRGQGRDRFESEKIEFFTRVRNCYLAEAAADPTIKVIDATRALEQVVADIRNVVEGFVCSRG